MANDKKSKKPNIGSAQLKKSLSKAIKAVGKVQFILVSLVVLGILGFTIMSASKVGSAKADEADLQRAILEASSKKIKFDEEAIEQVNIRTLPSGVRETNRNDPFNFDE